MLMQFLLTTGTTGPLLLLLPLLLAVALVMLPVLMLPMAAVSMTLSFM
jgi:hypothetical protein